MSRDDWLFDRGRHTRATERIYAAACELIARDGYEAFSIDVLAERVHCSRATIYRHVGGKAAVRDAVLARSAARIVDAVRNQVAGLCGAERVVTAIEIAVAQIRADPAGQLFIRSLSAADATAWPTSSPAVAGFAADLTGLADDPHAAKWIVRIVLSLLLWPDENPRAERRMLLRYVAPAFSTR